MKNNLKHNNNFTNYNSEHMADGGRYEQIRRKKPTKLHYSDTKTLLEDFRIFVIVPKFDTLAELLKWRKELISSRLA